jgi:hypothetical protein
MLQKYLKSWVCLTVALVAGSWVASTASAATITLGPPVQLSTLINNAQAEIIAGDKKFTGFGYAGTNDMPGAGGVNVIPIFDDLEDGNSNTGNYGIRFQGAFMDLVSSQGGSDALITYMVEVTDPTQLIKTAHLAGNPNLLGQFGSVSVTETFLPLGQNGEYTMEIYDDENFPTPKLTDTTTFLQGVTKLNVQKDILARAVAETAPNGNTATISFVDQTFGQIPVPEATTFTLAIAGVLSLAGFRRRS